MTHRPYQLLVLSGIALCSITTKAGQNPKYPKILSAQKQAAIDASLETFEQERAQREKNLKQQGRNALGLDNRTIPTPSAPPTAHAVPVPSGSSIPSTPPPAYEIAIASKKADQSPTNQPYPASKPTTAYPTSRPQSTPPLGSGSSAAQPNSASGQPASQYPASSAQPYPISPAQATPGRPPSAQPAASATTTAPRSSTQTALAERAAAARATMQSWGSYMSQRLQAGWASFKAWLDSWRR